MQNLPEIGKTYISEAVPGLLIHVENVETLEADENGPASAIIEGCAPADIGDMSGLGYEFTYDEWQGHLFKPHMP
jgi:hypothetical protein